MKNKKNHVAISVILGFLLAGSCLGFAFLSTAYFADHELYTKLTDPVKQFIGNTLERASLTVVDVQEKTVTSIQETTEYINDKVVETQENVNTYLEALKEVEEEIEEDSPDTQALSEALFEIPRDFAEYSVTHFTLDAETEIEKLTGGTHELIYYNQTDQQWGKYGYDSISGYGCGPTAMAMIVSTLGETIYSPQEMADIFVQEGFWCYGSGTYYSFAYGSGRRFDLKVETLSADSTSANTLLQHLMSGKLAVALMGPGHFTNGGHYVVLRGATLTGDVLVADPASRDRSLTTWDPQLLLDELSWVRSSGAPLWLFSPLEEIYEEDSVESIPSSLPYP